MDHVKETPAQVAGRRDSGASVHHPTDEDVGSIYDVTTDKEADKLVYALVAYRGGAWRLIDAYAPGMSGLKPLRGRSDHRFPAGAGDAPIAVAAKNWGAANFGGLAARAADLLASLAQALEQARGSCALSAAAPVAALTPRQRQIMDRVLAGHPSKVIAADLGISQRTVEKHRAEIMKRTGSKSLPALARLAMEASANGAAHWRASS